jgi:RNA binding exosome subunit
MGSRTGRPAVIGVQLSVFAYATEDEVKVERALRNAIPSDVSGVKFSSQRLTGHFRDPITVLTAEIRRDKDATKVFQATVRALPTLDRHRLIEEIVERTDKAGNLYIRLDKQRALTGVETLNDVDPVRIKFKFRVPHGEAPASFIRTAIEAVIDGN